MARAAKQSRWVPEKHFSLLLSAPGDGVRGAMRVKQHSSRRQGVRGSVSHAGPTGTSGSRNRGAQNVSLLRGDKKENRDCIVMVMVVLPESFRPPPHQSWPLLDR
ncbi:hypothetical protein E2C01_033240 [Portunus trituberculatus]|uniref:Uncharacterized protein n=1 Tax=Portunus trituberculatus TaxID=210409 RepID=A0A5B7F1X6_PORTR|nr:hypothetical protein [Portunus trituberculatus]